MKIEHIGAGNFKTHCLQLLDEVGQHHKELIITKHGKPIAKLIAISEENFSLYGCMSDSVIIKKDNILSTGEDWEADA